MHQRFAGVFLAVLGGLILVPVSAMSLIGFLSNDGAAFSGVLGAFFGVVCSVFIAWCLSAIWAGLRLFQGRRSRLLVPASVLALIGFPFGTAAGIYALWSVWRDEAPKTMPEWRRLAARQHTA